MTSHLTFKAGGMPRFTHSLHPPVSTAYSTLTQTTFHAKQFVVIFLAVRFSSIDIEALGTDRSATVTAHKMFRMKSFTNGLYTRLWVIIDNNWQVKSDTNEYATPLPLPLGHSKPLNFLLPLSELKRQIWTISIICAQVLHRPTVG